MNGSKVEPQVAGHSVGDSPLAAATPLIGYRLKAESRAADRLV
jgi:hypothetical protein